MKICNDCTKKNLKIWLICLIAKDYNTNRNKE